MHREFSCKVIVNSFDNYNDVANDLRVSIHLSIQWFGLTKSFFGIIQKPAFLVSEKDLCDAAELLIAEAKHVLMNLTFTRIDNAKHDVQYGEIELRKLEQLSL